MAVELMQPVLVIQMAVDRMGLVVIAIQMAVDKM
jgi:hypothetical protein